jgi:hypothetical protein
VEGRGVAFSVPAALSVLAYLTTVSFAWYRHWWGLGASAEVVPLALGGVAVFFAVLRVHRGFRLRDWSRETAVVVVSSLTLFTLFWYFGRRPAFSLWFGEVDSDHFLSSLFPFFFFVGASVLTRAILPLVVARFALGRRPADYGWNLRGTFDLWWIYALAVVVAIPMVGYASTLGSFVRKYPLCKQAIEDGQLSMTVFVSYQLVYSLLFASGESFWRGFMLFGLGRQLGYNALFFMILPYVISHFGKPQPESFGAIGAGLFLGYLASRHRSFWLGVLAHWSVAVMMDVWAIYRRGVEWVP